MVGRHSERVGEQSPIFSLADGGPCQSGETRRRRSRPAAGVTLTTSSRHREAEARHPPDRSRPCGLDNAGKLDPRHRRDNRIGSAAERARDTLGIGFPQKNATGPRYRPPFSPHAGFRHNRRFRTGCGVDIRQARAVSTDFHQPVGEPRGIRRSVTVTARAPAALRAPCGSRPSMSRRSGRDLAGQAIGSPCP